LTNTENINKAELLLQWPITDLDTHNSLSLSSYPTSSWATDTTNAQHKSCYITPELHDV